jgi:hypothetical protein
VPKKVKDYRHAKLLGYFVVAILITLLATSARGAQSSDASGYSVPENPYLADSAWPITHHDSYASDTSPLPGVLGSEKVDVLTQRYLEGPIVFPLFNSRGEVIATTKNPLRPKLLKLDPDTLEPLMEYDLPRGGGVYGGVYFYLDDQDRVVMGSGKKLLRYREDSGTFVLDTQVDLTRNLARGEELVTVAPLYSGEIAYVGTKATVGVVSGETMLPLDEYSIPSDAVRNGFALDETGGIFVVTEKAMYGFHWDGAELTESWSEAVEASSSSPRDRVFVGSGTTPTLMGEDYVTIADDAESTNVVVFRRDADIGEQSRQVCKVPAFDGPATTEASLVVYDRSIIAERNLIDYKGEVSRIDVRGDGSGCDRVWVQKGLKTPSTAHTMSIESGIVYVYEIQYATSQWYLTGLRFTDGKVLFRAPVGRGPFYLSGGGVTIGTNGRIYLGLADGVVMLQ